MSTAAEAREELAKVASLVTTARRLVAGGTLVDLCAIEERVRAVCGTVQAMPRDEGRGLLDDMQALIAKLDRLSEDLSDQLGQLSLRLEGG